MTRSIFQEKKLISCCFLDYRSASFPPQSPSVGELLRSLRSIKYNPFYFSTVCPIRAVRFHFRLNSRGTDQEKSIIRNWWIGSALEFFFLLHWGFSHFSQPANEASLPARIPKDCSKAMIVLAWWHYYSNTNAIQFTIPQLPTGHFHWTQGTRV